MRLKQFFALSRTPHALLDLAAPAFAALVWLNSFPPLWVVLVGLLTSFAAYTTVYAFNDLVDYSADKRRLSVGCDSYGDYLDAAMSRHPAAQGLISLKAAIIWTVSWAAVAAAGSIVLNPTCLYIFLAAFALEGAYCRLSEITPLRTLIAGVVKTAGPIAAIFAVAPHPDPLRLVLLFGWLFLWEIGGQNIPADWTDIDEDRRLGGQTLPVRLQAGGASRLVVSSLVGSLVLSLFLIRHVSLTGSLLYYAAAVSAGLLLLVVPALRLFFANMRGGALLLFNRASYYPVTLLGVIVVKAVLRI